MKRTILAICAVLITVVAFSSIAMAKKATTPVVTQQMERFCFKVVDNEGEPLFGVSVQIKGTTRGAMTDLDGNVCIDIRPGEVLVISYIGYKTQEYTYKRQSSVTIRLVCSSDGLD